MYLTQVGRVGGAGACGHVTQGVATKIHIAVCNHHIACGVGWVADGEAVAIQGNGVAAWRTCGHGCACDGIGSDFVKYRPLSHLDLHVAQSIGYGLNVFCAICASSSGGSGIKCQARHTCSRAFGTDNAQGFTQIAVNSSTTVA